MCELTESKDVGCRGGNRGRYRAALLGAWKDDVCRSGAGDYGRANNGVGAGIYDELAQQRAPPARYPMIFPANHVRAPPDQSQ